MNDLKKHIHGSGGSGTPADMAARFAAGHGDGFPLRIRRLDAPYSRIECPSPPMRSPIHTFIYLESGEAMVAVGEERLLLQHGECMLIPAGLTLAVLYYYNCVGYMGGFRPELLGDGSAGNLLRRCETLRGWSPVRVTFDEAGGRFVANTLERLAAEVAASRNMEIIRIYLAAFMTEIDSRCCAAANATDGDEHLCERFVAMIFESSDRRARIGDYAERLGVSSERLYRAVKRATGKTPLRWIDEAVVSEAKALLSHTDLTVGEIAGRVGVLDSSYFSRFFRKQVGMTPVDFRAAMKKSRR